MNSGPTVFEKAFDHHYESKAELNSNHVYRHQQEPSAMINKHCRLCGSTEALQNSHIVSKFLWKLSKITGDKKKFNSICLNDDSLSNLHQQDGFKEVLLCLKCEQRRGRLEDFARRELFGRLRQLDFDKGTVIMSGLDYSKMKLFTMFQIWMMGVSSLPFYAHVELGAHDNRLADLLLADDPGEPWQYGSAITVIGGNNEKMAGMISQPQRIRLGGQNAYRFVIAGLHFFFMYPAAHQRTTSKTFFCRGMRHGQFSAALFRIFHTS